MLSSLKFRILIPVALVLVLSSFILTYNSFLKTRAMMSHQEMERYNYIQILLQGNMNSITKQARLGIESVVNNPVIQEAFAAKDREKLLKLTAPIFEQAKKEGVAQFQFHLSPATSFLRLHMPGKYGDDLSSFRKTVVEANSTRKTVEGLEEGRGDFGFRVVMPVFHQGNHVGSAEYGIGFDKKVLDQWQKETGGQLYVYRAGKTNISWVGDKTSDLMISTEKEDLSPVDEEIINKALTQDKMEVAFINNNRHAALIIPLKDYSGQATNYLKIVLSRETILSQMGGAVKNSVLILVLNFVIISLLMYILIQKVLRPVYELKDAMEQVGKGDLSVNLVCSAKDEIGQLVHVFCRMQQNIRDLIGRIADSAHRLTGAGQKLSSTARQTSASIQEVSAIAEKLALATNRLADSSREITGRAEHAYQSATAGKTSVEILIRQMLATQERIQSLAVEMNRLEHSSDQINQIVSIITEIADQTNLLALNASIEAARAGDHGKGFAVVAEEVRKLAEQSGAAATGIRSITLEIQQKTCQGLKDTEKGVSEMQKSMQLGENTKEMFQQVVSAIENVAAQANEVFSSCKEINQASHEVASAMEEQARDMESVPKTAVNLTLIAEEMNNKVAGFKL